VASLFAFVQFEFGWLLGPPDGRYVLRREPDAEPETVVVLRTLGAPERRRLRGRRPRRVAGAEEPEPVPTSRATLVRAEGFRSEAGAAEWLHRVRGDAGELRSSLAEAARELNAVLRAFRAAAVDPYVRDVAADHALVVRVGYGAGEEVAEGRFSEAYELRRGEPGGLRRTKQRLAPDERFVAILNARDEVLPGEELLLRARADLNAGRPREAALQARIALETLSSELDDERTQEIERQREAVAAAASAAIDGEPPEPVREALERAVAAMEATLSRSR
jgi:uncharacterized protein (DUF2267 family)